MRRILLAVVLLQAVPGPQVWAQVAAVRPIAPVAAPVAPIGPLYAPVLEPITLSSSLAVPSLSLRPLSAPPTPGAAAASAAAGRAAAAGPAFSAAVPAAPAAKAQARAEKPVQAVLRALERAVGPVREGRTSQGRRSFNAVFDGGRAPSVPDSSALGDGTGTRRPGLAPTGRYLGGTFLQQTSNNAVHVTLPLAVVASGGTLGTAAVVVALAGWADAAGTMLGGWLADRFHPLSVLRAATALRAAALAAVPLALAAGGLGAGVVGAAFMADALGRGVSDTARNTLPLYFAGSDKDALSGFNGRFQSYFEAGALVGPFLVGGVLAFGAVAGQWFAPAAALAAAALYLAAPKPAAPEEGGGPSSRPGWGGVWTHLKGQPAAAAAFVGLAALTLYPLRAVLPAVWAVDILHAPAAAAWLVGAFGLGGLAGSLAYRAANRRLAPAAWLTGAAAGSVLLATAWLPGSLWALAAGIGLFAASNAAARLSLTSVLQASSPAGLAGGVMGASRFTVNMTAMAVKAAAAAALSLAAGSVPALGIVAGGVLLFGGAQLWSARRVAAAPAGALAPLGTPSPAHGLPGRLIVVEGLDGSGKSTQLSLLRDKLEAEGREVVVTSWNSSGLVSEGVKRAKKDEELGPRAFALAQAADLADRVEHTVLPALRGGKVVLADRWAYTGVARDSVRGSDRGWVETLYDFAPRPDLVLYYRAPVETAVARVLRRSGSASLSEDGEDDEALPAGGPQVKFYEGGLDLHLDEDPVGNFKAFQRRVTAVYDSLAAAKGFRILDAGNGVREVEAQTARHADAVLGRPGPHAARENLFDKDPAGDAENIRENYRDPKKGVHFYFRNMLIAMQERFAQLVNPAGMPVVYLHGNPHVDNYAKTNRGAAMADFDRSRRGPYAWDLVRLMTSLSLRQKTPHHGLLPKGVLKALRKGYLRGFHHPEKGWEPMEHLAGKAPKSWELTTDGYVAHCGKWYKELLDSPLAKDDPRVRALLQSYADHRGEAGFFERFEVEAAGIGHGSMGFRDLVLVLLKPKAGGDRILLNIKAVRSDPDSAWFSNPYPTDGERMLAAEALYAPGWEARSGRAEFGGVEYFVRQIPSQNAKLKKMLDRDQLEDLAYAAGTQLGRGHRLSVEGDPAAVEADLEARFDALAEASMTIREEVSAAHRRYLRRLEKSEEGR